MLDVDDIVLMFYFFTILCNLKFKYALKVFFSILRNLTNVFFTAGPGSGVRLVPTRLSNGDIALVLPAGVSANTLGAVPTLVPLSPRDASSSSSEPRCFSPESSGWGSPPPPSEDLAPLALVTRRQPQEEKPWRPW